MKSKMAPSTETECLDIKELVRDDRFQIREKLDPRVLRTYTTAMKGGALFPPVLVANIRGARVLVDGWHRVAASEAAGRREIEALVFDADENEAAWRSAQANLTHGLRLKPAEIREAFRAYVSAGRHRKGATYKSYREIAADLGSVRAHTTIRGWMREDFPSVFRRLSGNEEDAPGGLRDPQPSLCLFQVALEALQTAQNASTGVADPKELWLLLEKAKQIVAVLQPRAPQDDPDPNEF